MYRISQPRGANLSEWEKTQCLGGSTHLEDHLPRSRLFCITCDKDVLTEKHRPPPFSLALTPRRWQICSICEPIIRFYFLTCKRSFATLSTHSQVHLAASELSEVFEKTSSIWCCCISEPDCFIACNAVEVSLEIIWKACWNASACVFMVASKRWMTSSILLF